MNLKVELAPEAEGVTGFIPTTPAGLKAQATVGALLAILGCGDSLLRMGKLDPVLRQKFGMPALQRAYNEIDKYNHRFEKIWGVRDGDSMGCLHNDAAIIMMVLASVDMESRTNLANEFRKVWAQLEASVGDEQALENVKLTIRRIREERKLMAAPQYEQPGQPTDVFDHLNYDLGNGSHALGELPREAPTAQQLIAEAVAANHEYWQQGTPADETLENAAVGGQPNCMLFVRDAVTRQLLQDTDVHVVIKGDAEGSSERVDKIRYNGDNLYERTYPVNHTLTFTAFAPGYLPGGCEKLFYEGDPEQLVVNIYLTPAATEE